MKESIKKTAPLRSLWTATAIAAALGGGYALRGTQVTAQNTDPNAPNKTPIVQTAATNDAASMQKAFNEVSKAIEPGVVTIKTQERASRTSMRGTPRGGQRAPGGANPFGPGGEGDPFEEFFRQFRGFGGGGIQPNSYEKAEMRARFYEMQGRGGGQGGGLGSGMIYSPEGYILTNAHVVGDATVVDVILNDGREIKKAKVVGRDPLTDVAVVKIDIKNPPVVRFGDSSKVNVGDWAIAVGNPFGLSHTVTVGVISAKAREVPLSERNTDYIQTDASINPGNSGGPLCDIYGRVIGVNNAIYSQSGGNVGIGFAIPINLARDIASRIEKGGKVTRAYLGVTISTVDEDTALGLGLDAKTTGVMVGGITDPNTPGAKAGLQQGDIIQEFNGQPVTKSSDLQRRVGDSPVGSTVTLKVLRNGQSVNLTATLGELPDDKAAAPAPAAAPDSDQGAVSGLPGLRLRSLTPQLAQRFGLTGKTGVVVVAVDPDSDAAAAGLQPGDLIERVGQKPATTTTAVQNEITRILGMQRGDEKRVTLFVNRGGQRIPVTINISG